MSFTSAITAAMERACAELDCHREQLAQRLEVNPNTLYNATKRPRVIGLEVVEGIAHLAKLSPTEALTLYMAWVRDRAESEELLAAFVDYFEERATEMPPEEWMTQALSILRRYQVRRQPRTKKQRRGA